MQEQERRHARAEPRESGATRERRHAEAAPRGSGATLDGRHAGAGAATQIGAGNNVSTTDFSRNVISQTGKITISDAAAADAAATDANVADTAVTAAATTVATASAERANR